MVKADFEDKYRALFRRYHSNLLFYATRLVGEVEAEDVVEDVQEHWYSTTLSFNKSGLRSIAATLERIYGVKLILSPQLDLQKTYTGTVPKKETVEEVLELMQNAIPIKYKVVGNSVFITK